MAEYLAKIFGTEKDKVNCSFYYKVGACRHGERCSRKHVKPTFSQTVLIANMYQVTEHANKDQQDEIQREFDLFYEDVFMELSKFGEIQDLAVCENIGDHLNGNVYCQFVEETSAAEAVENLNNRFYAGRPLYAELSPVTDFREACCKQHQVSACSRGGYCNFMHLRHPSKRLLRDLKEAQHLSMRDRTRRCRDRYPEDQLTKHHESSERYTTIATQ